jgi:hypothetical protein
MATAVIAKRAGVLQEFHGKRKEHGKCHALLIHEACETPISEATSS